MREFHVEIPMGRIAGLRNQGDSHGKNVPRVLALHGWLDNAASFIPLAPHLHGIDLVAIDQPGHGRSAHLPPGTDYSFVGAINAILDVADALGWERFALLGHSMGGGISSLIAAACPERIERLVASRLRSRRPGTMVSVVIAPFLHIVQFCRVQSRSA